MRKTFYLPLSLFSIVLIFCCSLEGLAQNREKFVISARAGGINAVTGDATVISRGESSGQQLMITDDLRSGDRVRTAFDGRVEILLNPGSYLRLGGNSEVELLDNSLANLEVKLLRGTAIVEAAGADGLELNIGISTPHTRLVIVRQGLYRLNVVPEDATELIVRKGRVILSDPQQTKVKGGNKVVFNATNVAVAKLTKEEKKQKDDVEVWSKDRGETLAKVNRRITDKMMMSAFSTFQNPYDPWRMPYYGRGLGVWFFNAHAGCYTFLPFYYGIGSPYGPSYSTAIYSPYANRTWGTYYPQDGSNGAGNSGGSNGGGSAPSAGGGTSGGGNRPAPPIIQPSGGATRGDGGFGRAPRSMPDMPRKNLERLPNAP